MICPKSPIGLVATLLLAFGLQAEPTTITVWLLPSERGLDSDVTDVKQLERQIDEFELREVPSGVVLENVSDPVLRAQLLAWNPAFAMPNFGWLRGQTATLSALGRFARTHGVQLRVRFNTWANALSELYLAADEGRLPDVAQVGSTWISDFAARRMITSAPLNSQEFAWRNIHGMPRASLKYLIDVRLIFYWQQLISDRHTSKAFLIDSSSWRALVDSLRRTPGPPMAMPIGLTYNIEHDLFPLLAANPGSLFVTGPWTTKIDLSRPETLATLDIFASEAVMKDVHGYPKRLLAFPEVTHEEAIRSFETGGYLAIIEPLGFLNRWHEAFKAQHDARDFWELAGVAAPPTGLLGGSDLVVTRHAHDISAAFSLSSFLATDPEYTDVLTSLGNLPANFADRKIDPLIEATVGHERQDVVRQIGREVRLALNRSKEYPALSSWAEVEGQPIQEISQRVWRRIAEGDVGRVKAAVQELQHAINIRIDPGTKLTERLAMFWREISVLFCVVLVVIAASASRRARMLKRVRKVRGFSSAALATLDSVHQRFNPFRGSEGTKLDAEKAALVSVGLLGLRRGLKNANWRPQRLSDVAWRAIVFAMDSIWDVTTSRTWQHELNDPQLFLSQLGLLRPEPDFKPGYPPFHFSFDIQSNPRVSLPILLEQALTGLIQNALIASASAAEGGEAYYLPIAVEIRRNQICIINKLPQQRSMSSHLLELLNDSTHIEDFERRVLALLDGPVEHRPGIGLVEAYCIAAECYGGLSAAILDDTVIFMVQLRRTWVSVLRSGIAVATSGIRANWRKIGKTVEAQ